MDGLIGPALFALFVWWGSTAAVLFFDNLPGRTHRWTMAAATALAVLGAWGMMTVKDGTDPVHAYLGFLAGLALWGWHEVSFLLGYVTGANRRPCPPDAAGWRRFRLAAGTLMHHELAILATAAVMAVAVWGAPNQTALWTFLVLWIMRLSAKLNIFLGVSNLAEEFLPPHLTYLKTYFTRARMNPLFPVSVGLGSLVAAVLTWAAIASPSPFETTALALTAALLALAILEHLFLVLPLPDAALWRWALPDGKRPPPRGN